MTIFKDHAPAYYAAGLQVIPLYSKEKKPIPLDWSRFADTKVEDSQQAAWLRDLPDSNIGVVLGQASGLIMIDIDTESPTTTEAILSVLPPSPWKRIGAKGMMLAYKWSPIKTHRIKNLSGQTIVETLSSRTQAVLPPSIHPTTLKPYHENTELVGVLHQLVCLPENIEEILREVISRPVETGGGGVELSHSGWSRVTEYVSAGSRDTTLTELAGLFAFAITRGERTLREAIGMLTAYHNEFIENTAGDVVPLDKHIGNLIKFLHRDVLDKNKVLPRGWDKGYELEDLKRMGVTLGEAETEWNFDQVRTFLQSEFEANTEGRARVDAVERVLSKVARSNQLSKIDEERIIKYIMDVGGLGVGIGTLRKRIVELRAGDVTGTDHSEIARAVIKDLEQYNIVRYHNEEFMKWMGSHWVKMDKDLIYSLVSSRYGHLPACKKSNDITGIVKVMAFNMDKGIQKKDVVGINFANGLLTSDLKLLPHDPDYGMTYTLPYRYMPEEAGKFPEFAKFLSRVWGEDADYHSKMAALQQVMAVTLFGLGPRYQRAILLHGAANTGKSQLLRIVQMLVPVEAKCAIPPNKWDQRFFPTKMFGCVLNLAGELDATKRIDGQTFKEIIDGSDIVGEYKGQQLFTFKPMLTHWFASNHIPRSTDTSMGFIRRWLIFTFSHPIKDAEVVRDLGDKISAEEREAISAWAAQAMPALQTAGYYVLPPSHLEMVEELANINNSVRYFLTESNLVVMGIDGKSVDETTLYNSYWGFCAGMTGAKAVSVNTFKQLMRELGVEFGFSVITTPSHFGGVAVRYKGLAMERPGLKAVG